MEEIIIGALALWLLPILIVACVFGGFTAYVAQEKAYDSMPWLFLGILFGPLALLAAVGLPDKKAR